MTHASDSFVPQCDLGASVNAQRDALDTALREVLDSGWFILGKHVEKIEQAFAEYCGVSHAIGVANGTDALEIAFRALHLGPGDAVLVPGNSVSASASAVMRVGARPVFCDVDPHTYGMCPDHARHLIQLDSSIGAMTPVHLYGHPCDMDGLTAVSKETGVPIVEDVAQAPGARWRNQMVGQFGVMASYSFYPTKNLGGLGDGGLITTNDPALAEEIRSLRQYGWKQRFVSDIPGVNSRLDEMQAAILLTRLPGLEESNCARNRIANRYLNGLQKLPVILPTTAAHAHHVYHQFVIQADDRDELASKLKEEGIGTAIQYPVPLHQQPAFAPFSNESLPVSEALADRVLSLPMFPQLRDEQVERVITAMQKLLV